MKRSAALLLATALSAPAVADEAPVAGDASLDGGRFRLSIEGGFASVGVDPIAADGILEIDGVRMVQRGPDSVDGSFIGGKISYVLDEPEEMTWLGRNVRIVGGYERLRATSSERSEGAGPTMSESNEVISVALNGGAIAREFSSTSAASAFALVLPETIGLGLACVDSNGSVTANAGYPMGSVGPLTCSATPFIASAAAFASTPTSLVAAAATAYVLPGGSIDLLHRSSRSNDVTLRRGFAGIEGDHEIAPSLTFSPSLQLIAGTGQRWFTTADLYADDFASPLAIFSQAVSGRLAWRDRGARVEIALTYDAGGGFDLFGGAGAELSRRKAVLTATGGTAAAQLGEITTATSFLNGDPLLSAKDTTTAFGGSLEGGAGYTFGEAFGVGPLRLSLSGELTYDGDVPTYGHVGNGELSGPHTTALSPMHVAYSGETNYSLTAALTIALP